MNEPLTKDKMDDKRFNCPECGCKSCTLEEVYYQSKDVFSAVEGLKKDLDGMQQFDDENSNWAAVNALTNVIDLVDKWFPAFTSYSFDGRAPVASDSPCVSLGDASDKISAGMSDSLEQTGTPISKESIARRIREEFKKHSPYLTTYVKDNRDVDLWVRSAAAKIHASVYGTEVDIQFLHSQPSEWKNAGSDLIGRSDVPCGDAGELSELQEPRISHKERSSCDNEDVKHAPRKGKSSVGQFCKHGYSDAMCNALCEGDTCGCHSNKEE